MKTLALCPHRVRGDAKLVGFTLASVRSRLGPVRQTGRALVGFGRALDLWLGYPEPRLLRLFLVALVLCVVSYVRSLWTNYIFDEQEALLANPYVNGTGLGVWEAFQRDFWGLPVERTIGSYRPIPNLIWRGLWNLREHPWPAHAVNLCMHAGNAALLAAFAWRWRRQRAFSLLTGLSLLLAAVLTEAVCGVVGLADILAGTAALAALHVMRLSLVSAVLAGSLIVFLGLLCKESVLSVLPILPWAAWITAPALHPGRPRRGLRVLGSMAASAAGLAAYVCFRSRVFPAVANEVGVAPGSGHRVVPELLEYFLRWFRQPKLPIDEINNPLAHAAVAERVGAACRIYLRGLEQLAWPFPLSGDYSFAQELPLEPGQTWGLEPVLGAVLLLFPLLLGLILHGRSWRFCQTRGAARGAVLALGLVWIPITYFPHSNLLVLLPTVRAERFWYTPMIGVAMVMATAMEALLEAAARWQRSRDGIRRGNQLVCRARDLVRRRAVRVVQCSILGFFALQAASARWHAFDYNDDLAFWAATARTSPHSAKAHLNHGVMLGARGDLQGRLAASERALALAPQWAMAHIYLADSLCRLQQPDRAWPHYQRGFELGPNEQSLIALALQCLWEQEQVQPHRALLLELADDYPGTWLSYLTTEVLTSGQQHGGVPVEYRPRGYDEGLGSDVSVPSSPDPGQERTIIP